MQSESEMLEAPKWEAFLKYFSLAYCVSFFPQVSKEGLEWNDNL